MLTGEWKKTCLWGLAILAPRSRRLKAQRDGRPRLPAAARTRTGQARLPPLPGSRRPPAGGTGRGVDPRSSLPSSQCAPDGKEKPRQVRFHSQVAERTPTGWGESKKTNPGTKTGSEGHSAGARVRGPQLPPLAASPGCRERRADWLANQRAGAGTGPPWPPHPRVRGPDSPTLLTGAWESGHRRRFRWPSCRGWEASERVPAAPGG